MAGRSDVRVVIPVFRWLFDIWSRLIFLFLQDLKHFLLDLPSSQLVFLSGYVSSDSLSGH